MDVLFPVRSRNLSISFDTWSGVTVCPGTCTVTTSPLAFSVSYDRSCMSEAIFRTAAWMTSSMSERISMIRLPIWSPATSIAFWVAWRWNSSRFARQSRCWAWTFIADQGTPCCAANARIETDRSVWMNSFSRAS